LAFAACDAGAGPASVQSTTSTADLDNVQLVTSCQASLIGPSIADDAPLTASKQSRPFNLAEGLGSGSTVNLPLGDFNLIASMSDSTPTPGTDVALFRVELIKGNPISGQINLVEATGLDLARRTPGVPLTLGARNFVSTKFQGQDVSRIDYSCSITKLAGN
jgi:hypothetical protein